MHYSSAVLIRFSATDAALSACLAGVVSATWTMHRTIAAIGAIHSCRYNQLDELIRSDLSDSSSICSSCSEAGHCST